MHSYNTQTKRPALHLPTRWPGHRTAKRAAKTTAETFRTLFYKMYVSFSRFLPQSIAGTAFHAQNCAVLLGDAALADPMVLLIRVFKCTQTLLAL